jgi:hypothetical protein
VAAQADLEGSRPRPRSSARAVRCVEVWARRCRARECGTNEICQRLTRLVASEAPAEAQSTGATGAGGGQTASATGCFETSAEALGENSEEKEGNSGDAGASLSPRSCLLRRRGLGRFLDRVALRPFSTTVMSGPKSTKFPKNGAAWEVEDGGSG